VALTSIKSTKNLYYFDRVKRHRWRDEHDQSMVELVDLVVQSGMTIGEIQERILDMSDNQVHISYSTIANWLDGKTRRPQNFTLNWVWAAVGYARKWERY